ncbi:hypothetical protein GA0115246_115364, partial [Streptomyces sp. SolWspMP-sol7th]
MPGWIYLGHVGDAQPRLVFQPVPETRRDKVCPHLDVAVDDITTGITQVLDRRAGETGERHEYAEGVVVIMTDPEGHEFCLSQFYWGPAVWVARQRSEGGLYRAGGLYGARWGGAALRTAS